MNEYTIILFWDDEASVWVAESQDLPGLILESVSFDTLVERVKKAVPDLLELNETHHSQIKLHFLTFVSLCEPVRKYVSCHAGS
jgi:predicted RNase H-like HicB family nuclease